jgi:glucan 1,3-beta-glucosidase
MQFLLWAVSCLFVSHANALVDLPAVSKVVEAELSALPLSRYTANHATASTTLSTVFANATAHALDLKIEAAVSDPAYWLKDITHQGLAAFNSNPSGYVVFRNVKDYGAKGPY